MIIVGLSGGIGSGKTTVAGMFADLGIPVYIADVRAKELMVESQSIRSEVTKLLGSNAYLKGTLNRKFIADTVFKDTKMLNALNAIVHPEVQRDFGHWCSYQKSPYVVKEAAILFENGGYKKCDYMILVTAQKAVKLQRLLKRDKTTLAEIESRMAVQWPDTQKFGLADFTIVNSSLNYTQEQVTRVHKHILRRIRLGW